MTSSDENLSREWSYHQSEKCGNCQTLGFIDALSKSEEGRTFLNKTVRDNGDGSYSINFRGHAPFTITKEEMAATENDNYSKAGSPKAHALEVATQKVYDEWKRVNPQELFLGTEKNSNLLPGRYLNAGGTQIDDNPTLLKQVQNHNAFMTGVYHDMTRYVKTEGEQIGMGPRLTVKDVNHQDHVITSGHTYSLTPSMDGNTITVGDSLSPDKPIVLSRTDASKIFDITVNGMPNQDGTQQKLQFPKSLEPLKTASQEILSQQLAADKEHGNYAAPNFFTDPATRQIKTSAQDVKTSQDWAKMTGETAKQVDQNLRSEPAAETPPESLNPDNQPLAKIPAGATRAGPKDPKQAEQLRNELEKQHPPAAITFGSTDSTKQAEDSIKGLNQAGCYTPKAQEKEKNSLANAVADINQSLKDAANRLPAASSDKKPEISRGIV